LNNSQFYISIRKRAVAEHRGQKTAEAVRINRDEELKLELKLEVVALKLEVVALRRLRDGDTGTDVEGVVLLEVNP
jgi:hypothetical protein